MRLHLNESIWMNQAGACSVEYLAEASGLPLDEVEDLIECGVITPMEEQARQARTFQPVNVVTLRTARRLRDDFELDRHGVALALVLLRRIERMEQELNGLKKTRTHALHQDSQQE